MFKITNEQTDFPDVPIDRRIFHFTVDLIANSMAIKPFQCQSSQFLNSFFPRTSSQWNSLPASVVSQTAIPAFKKYALADLS